MGAGAGDAPLEVFIAAADQGSMSEPSSSGSDADAWSAAKKT